MRTYKQTKIAGSMHFHHNAEAVRLIYLIYLGAAKLLHFIHNSFERETVIRHLLSFLH